MTHAIIITGPPGVGKTTVAGLLADSLDGVTASISGDVFVLAVTPFEVSDDRRLFLLRNLASFARNSVANGYDWIVIECVIPSDEFLNDLITNTGLPKECVTVVSLLAERDAYEARVVENLQSQAIDEIDITSCREWMTRIAALKTPTPIDTSHASPAETVAALHRILRTAR